MSTTILNPELRARLVAMYRERLAAPNRPALARRLSMARHPSAGAPRVAPTAQARSALAVAALRDLARD